MKLFLDTEFNGFEGELISMALVTEDGREWYQVRQMDDDRIEPWVQEHVMPKLNLIGEPLTNKEFHLSLEGFLSNFNGCEIIADWPADFEHLCGWMSGLGASANWSIPIECTMRLIRGGDIQPENPHNALSDARALRDWYLAQAIENQEGEAA